MEATAQPRDIRSRLNVYLVDPSREVRQQQRRILTAGDVVVVGEDDQLTGRVQRVSQLAPDVVLLDSDCVTGEVADLAVHVRSLRLIGCMVVILTHKSIHTSSDEIQESASAALAAGASAYLLKDRAPLELADVVYLVASGRAVVDQRVLNLLVGATEQTAVDPELARRVAMLSRRERQVMRMIFAGKSNLEIAHELKLSVATVKSHVSAILRTLQLRDRVQIAIAESHLSGQAAPWQTEWLVQRARI